MIACKKIAIQIVYVLICSEKERKKTTRFCRRKWLGRCREQGLCVLQRSMCYWSRKCLCFVWYNCKYTY